MISLPPRVTALAGLAAAPVAAAALLAAGHPPSRPTALGATASLDELVAATAATAVWLVLGWSLLASSLAVLAAVPGWVGAAAGGLSRRLTPALLRRVARTALGAGIVVGTVGAPVPAFADDGDLAVEGTGPFDRPAAPLSPAALASPAPTPAPAVDAGPARPTDVEVRSGPGGFVLEQGSTAADRPAAPAPPTSAPAAPAAPDPPRIDSDAEVVVRRGDTLWALAAARLGPAASPARVAAEWRRWWVANRTVIGPDPDLIHPGQRLRPPPR